MGPPDVGPTEAPLTGGGQTCPTGFTAGYLILPMLPGKALAGYPDGIGSLPVPGSMEKCCIEG